MRARRELFPEEEDLPTHEDVVVAPELCNAERMTKIGYEITNLRNVVLIRDSNSGKSLKKMKEQT